MKYLLIIIIYGINIFSSDQECLSKCTNVPRIPSLASLEWMPKIKNLSLLRRKSWPCTAKDTKKNQECDPNAQIAKNLLLNAIRLSSLSECDNCTLTISRLTTPSASDLEENVPGS